MSKSIHSKKYDRFRGLLIEARRKVHMTQMDVAKILSHPQSYVSKYEGGERRLDVIEFLEISSALKCDPVEIIKEINILE